MKHATDNALNQLEELLGDLRKLDYLKEKKPGIFYMKSRAFLHFHEDPMGLFADVRLKDDFERFAVNTKAERSQLFHKITAMQV